ncbi:MAG: DUF1573 domain-containing protein [Lacunisphaera sp.]|nr:DUF1573 domain-containing protein [Lacunisphaera sp.]
MPALICLTPMLPTSGFGALTWETQKISRTAQLGDKEVVAVFSFKNTGTYPVTIREIQSSCECTVAELAKRTYAPGEGDAIKMIFTIGDRMGPQDRLMTTITDDPTAPLVNLTLRVDIPDLLHYSARMLYWQVHGALGEKPIEISAAGENRITTIAVKEIVPQQAVARVETMQTGEKYRLLIQPNALDQPRTIALTFVAHFADGTQHSFMIYALVR